MTIWEYKKNNHTPLKHEPNKSAWRSFGTMINNNNSKDSRTPGVIDNLNFIKKFIDRNEIIYVNIISAIYNNNPSSRTMINEVYDNFSSNIFVITDNDDDGWVERIDNTINLTKDVIDKTFKYFIKDIKKIRNIESKNFISNKLEELYFEIDKPFRDWLSGITYKDNKDKKIDKWKKILKKIIITKAKEEINNASPRDFTGIVKENSVVNIATVFNLFISKLNRTI